MFFSRHASTKKVGTAFSNKALLRLILPLIAEQFLAVLVGVADTVMVSGVGESAVAAVSLVDVMNIFFIQMFTAMAAGGAIIASQYMGSKETDNACTAGHQLLLFNVAISTALAALIILFNRQIIGLMDSGNDPLVFEQACTYLIITALSYPFLGMMRTGASLLRVIGNTKASLHSSVITNVINISGNFLFINAFGMGVAGAALSTLISRIVAAIVILRLMFRQNQPLHFMPLGAQGFFRFNGGMIRRIVRLGVPSGIENSLFQLGRLLVAGLVATFPTALRAAHGICNSVTSFAYLPNTAISLAAITVIGRLIGANQKEEAWYYGKKLLRWLYVALLPTNLILCCFSTPLAQLFNLSAEAVPVASQIIFLFGALSIIMYAPAFGLSSILRAAGDVRYTIWISIPSMLFLRLGFSYLFVYVFDLSLLGVWLAMHLDWIARALGFLGRFLSKKWLDKRAI